MAGEWQVGVNMCEFQALSLGGGLGFLLRTTLRGE